MARAVVVVAYGTPRPGEWCEQCRLPSAVERDLWMFTADGLRLVGTITHCTEAGHGDR